MKEVKLILFSLFIAAYTSSWWAATRWGGESESPLSMLWMVPGILTFFFVVLSVSYLVENWKS